MTGTILVVLAGVAIGGFSLLGGVYDWDFFMENRRAAQVIAVIGRPAARWFYIGIGLLLLSAAGFTMVSLLGGGASEVPPLP